MRACMYVCCPDRSMAVCVTCVLLGNKSTAQVTRYNTGSGAHARLCLCLGMSMCSAVCVLFTNSSFLVSELKFIFVFVDASFQYPAECIKGVCIISVNISRVGLSNGVCRVCVLLWMSSLILWHQSYMTLVWWTTGIMNPLKREGSCYLFERMPWL